MKDAIDVTQMTMDAPGEKPGLVGTRFVVRADMGQASCLKKCCHPLCGSKPAVSRAIRGEKNYQMSQSVDFTRKRLPCYAPCGPRCCAHDERFYNGIVAVTEKAGGAEVARVVPHQIPQIPSQLNCIITVTDVDGQVVGTSSERIFDMGIGKVCGIKNPLAKYYNKFIGSFTAPETVANNRVLRTVFHKEQLAFKVADTNELQPCCMGCCVKKRPRYTVFNKEKVRVAEATAGESKGASLQFSINMLDKSIEGSEKTLVVASLTEAANMMTYTPLSPNEFWNQ